MSELNDQVESGKVKIRTLETALDEQVEKNALLQEKMANMQRELEQSKLLHSAASWNAKAAVIAQDALWTSTATIGFFLDRTGQIMASCKCGKTGLLRSWGGNVCQGCNTAFPWVYLTGRELDNSMEALGWSTQDGVEEALQVAVKSAHDSEVEKFQLSDGAVSIKDALGSTFTAASEAAGKQVTVWQRQQNK